MLSISHQQIKPFVSALPVCVVYAYTPTCSACASFGPLIDSIQRKHPEILIRKINIIENQDFAVEMNVEQIPTMYIYSEGELIGSGTSQNPEGIDALLDYLKTNIKLDEQGVVI